MPYSAHFLRRFYRKGGKALGLMVKALPAGQFTVVDTVTVLNKLRAWHKMATDRYGLQFRWIMMVGDISAMYDEIDPKIACDALRQALSTV